MTRQEFDQAFRPMCQALGVKVNQAQADYFFHEFGRDDPRDFTHACRELAMGNPGYLPKLDFFRSNVVAAKDMRMERERQERAGGLRLAPSPATQGHNQEKGGAEMSELAPFRIVLTLQGRLVDGSGYRDVGVAHFDYGKAERFREAHERAYNALLFWQRVDQLDSAGEPTLF